MPAVSGFDLNHWVTTIIITSAHSRFKSKMALSESLHPGFNHSLIEQACSCVGEVLALLCTSGDPGAFFSAVKLPQIEAHFFKNLPMSDAWAAQLPEFICTEVERMLACVDKSEKAAAFEHLSTVLRIMPLLLIRDVFEEVDAMNKQGKWFQAFVVSGTASSKKVHFMGWQKSHDEEIPADKFDTHIRARSAACEIGPRGKETADTVRQAYGISPAPASAVAAAAAGGGAAAAEPDAASVNNPTTPQFSNYIKGFGDAAVAAVRSFFSRLPHRRIVALAVELLAFARVSSTKFCEIFNFELLDLLLCESASAFAKAASEAPTPRLLVLVSSSSPPTPGSRSLFSKLEASIIEHGHTFSEGEGLTQQQIKLLFESLPITARDFMRKVVSSMSADALQLELTSLISLVFSLCDGQGQSTAAAEKDAASKRAHSFHLFRIMSEISEHSSPARAGTGLAAPSASKELICRCMLAAAKECAQTRGADPDLCSVDSQLIALSVAAEWMSLTTSGQVQNGTGSLPIAHQSLHPYADTAHESTHEVCIPEAIALKIHFNKKSETHSEAHCVTFTSGSLLKSHVYSHKAWAGVGSVPKLVIDGNSFTASFSSNGGGSKWGYLFTVTPVFPDLSSLLLLPLQVTISALCFGSVHSLLKSSAAPSSVRPLAPPPPPCPIAYLIDHVRRQSDVGVRFQHLIRDSHGLIRVFKDAQLTRSASLLAQARALPLVNVALPHVRSHTSHPIASSHALCSCCVT